MVVNIMRRQGAVVPTPVVTLSDATFLSTTTDPASAYCALSFGSDGSCVVAANSGTYANWLQFGAASDYQLMATTTTGTLSVGTPGTWLSFPVTLAVSKTASGDKAWTGTIQIRKIVGAVVVAGPNNLSLTATVYPSGSGGGGDSFPPGGVFGGTGNGSAPNLN